VYSIKALLDSGAMDNFIDRDFIQTKGINTQSIFRPIPVYNVDGSPNEAGQISEVVDVVLRYKTLNVCRSEPSPEYAEDLKEDEAPVWTQEAEYEPGD